MWRIASPWFPVNNNTYSVPAQSGRKANWHRSDWLSDNLDSRSFSVRSSRTAMNEKAKLHYHDDQLLCFEIAVTRVWKDFYETCKLNHTHLAELCSPAPQNLLNTGYVHRYLHSGCPQTDANNKLWSVHSPRALASDKLTSLAVPLLSHVTHVTCSCSSRPLTPSLSGQCPDVAPANI